MATPNDIAAYLARLGRSYVDVSESTWLLGAERDPVRIVVHHAPPLTVFRAKLFELGPNPSPALLRRLLELNASEMVSGAYAIEDGAVVAVESLQSENLDFNELEAAVDALTLAITAHYPVLSDLR